VCDILSRLWVKILIFLGDWGAHDLLWPLSSIRIWWICVLLWCLLLWKSYQFFIDNLEWFLIGRIWRCSCIIRIRLLVITAALSNTYGLGGICTPLSIIRLDLVDAASIHMILQDNNGGARPLSLLFLLSIIIHYLKIASVIGRLMRARLLRYLLNLELTWVLLLR